MVALYRSYVSLDRTQRRRVCEAAGLMLVIWCGLHVVRYSMLRTLLRRYAAAMPAASEADARADVVLSIRRAVGGVARRLPFAGSCLVQALTADALLRRHCIESRLVIGVRRTQTSSIEAHAWVDSDGDIVVGDIDSLADFSDLSG
jgi:hypothetical protein